MWTVAALFGQWRPYTDNDGTIRTVAALTDSGGTVRTVQRHYTDSGGTIQTVVALYGLGQLQHLRTVAALYGQCSGTMRTQCKLANIYSYSATNKLLIAEKINLWSFSINIIRIFYYLG